MTKLFDKQAMSIATKKFNLKFLLVGDSGAGKTHFCGTYTRGPVHVYMLDPGGEKTLFKLLNDRPTDCPLTIDRFPERKARWTDFWKQIQKDEKDGLFDELAERDGLVVLPDSLTAGTDMITREIAASNNRTLDSQQAPLRIQDWGQISQWTKTLISVFTDLPCAAVMTAHLYVETDQKEGGILGRYPMVTGALRTSMGRYFDEVYYLETVGKNYILNFREKDKFTAKSRFVTERSLKNITLDDLADYYTKGGDGLDFEQVQKNNQRK
jgi:GTPase SAR1 family protein